MRRPPKPLLVFFVVLGVVQLVNLVSGVPEEATAEGGGAFAAGYFTFVFLCLGAGAYGVWALLNPTEPAPPRTFTPGGQPQADQPYPGQPSPSPPYPGQTPEHQGGDTAPQPGGAPTFRRPGR